MKLLARLSLTATIFLGLLAQAGAIGTTRLTTEWTETPLAVTATIPRLGWQLTSATKGDYQTAYQLAIFRENSVSGEKISLWDSGKIPSSQSQMVKYGGPAPEPGARYWWQVRVWDQDDIPSEWSALTFWEQAPDDNRFSAQWIGAISREDSNLPTGSRDFHSPSLRDERTAAAWGHVPDLAKRSILLRKPVEVNKKIRKAVVHVSGLGHYELTINGQKVGDSEFAPLWSDYDKTVYYNSYPVENLLSPGENVFGVMLGNGFYNVAGDRYRKLWVSFGPPTLFLQAEITYEDGTMETVLSDGSWKWSESPVVFNCIFGGEDYDANLEQPGWDTPGFNDRTWRPAVVQAAPPGKLTAQITPPVKIMKTYPIAEVGVNRTDSGKLVFNMGQNLSGHPSLVVSGKKGQKARLVVGELLNADGSVNQSRTGSEHYYEYTLKGDGVETWTPRFSYYGFQYIEVENVIYLGEDPYKRPTVLKTEFRGVDPTFTLYGKKGDTFDMWFAKSLDRNGEPENIRVLTYTFTEDGVALWTPALGEPYVYMKAHGANYIHASEQDVPVLLEVTSNFVYNSVPETGTFESSNEIFDRTHWLINNAVKSNMQAVFTDCPHREKLGWLEQVHLVGPGLLYNYDLTQYLPKVLKDMEDAQHTNGLVPSIVPEYVDFGSESWGADFQDSPEWGAAVAIVPWQYYQFYGDDTLIREYYPAMCRYADYLLSKSDRYIVSHGLGDWYDYGEHSAGYSKNSPIALSATAHWYFTVVTVAESAKLIGDKAGEKKYTDLAANIRKAYNKEFFDKKTKQYATGSQFSNAVSIYMGLVEPRYRHDVLCNLAADIENRGYRLTTGDVGNRYLYKVLAENGLNELMYRMHNHYDAPGYGFQLGYGLTTLTEQWDPRKGNSWNHFMMGQIEEWFFESVAGIRCDDYSGFQNITFAPQIVGDMTHARATYASVYGEIVSDWNRDGNRLTYRVSIPVNATGRIILPERTSGVVLDGHPVNGPIPVFRSGDYLIEATLP